MPGRPGRLVTGTVPRMANSPSHGPLIIERILRDRDSIWRQINEQRDLKHLTVQMLASSAVSLAAYGIVLGASNSFWQALSSMVKLPLLFLATLAICLPTLYLFNLVFGARLSMAQAVALIMVSVTVTSVLTLAFAPISLFFLITAQSYWFFKLLNVGILVLTAVVGLRFLTVGMRSLNAYQEHRDMLSAVAASVADTAEADLAAVPSDGKGAVATKTAPVLTTKPLPAAGPARSAQPTSMPLLYIWILLFGFVGTQLAWTLRPFFGDPGKPFGLFRHISGTFYSDIFDTIGHLFGS
jgi:hypothetical protein